MMFKALLKKQFLQLFSGMFVDRKTGKAKSKGKIITSILLFAGLMVYLGVAFGFMNYLIADAAIEEGASWFFFLFILCASLAMGVIGSVFSTYSSLYKSKENEMLFALPIPTIQILAVRLIGVFALSALYSGFITLPAIFIYQKIAGFDAISLLFSLLMWLAECVLISVISCGLGYLVALVASKVKNKTLVTLIASLAFFACYYIFYFRLMNYMEELVFNMIAYSSAIKGKAYILYLLGCGFIDNVLGLAIMIVISSILAAFTIIVLNKNFIKLALVKDAVVKKEYDSSKVKSSSVKLALLKRDFARLTCSATYMLNAGLGILFMILAAGAVIVKRGEIIDLILQVLDIGIPAEMVYPFVGAGVALIAALLISMDCFTASSISLESKSIWIMQTLPVSVNDILDSKAYMAIILNGIAALILVISAGISIQLEGMIIALVVAFVLIYTMFSSYFGLVINLLFPNLKWTNETYVIKQSTSCFIALFGGWAIILVIGGVGYYCIFKNQMISVTEYLEYLTIFFTIVTALLRTWVGKKGAEIYANL